MSGGGSYGGGGGGGGEARSCDELIFDTTVRSPNADVVRRLKAGDVLAVTLEKDNVTIVAESPSGERVGSLVTSEQAQLLGCLKRGKPFVALVRSVQGGAVTVQVRPEAGVP